MKKKLNALWVTAALLAVSGNSFAVDEITSGDSYYIQNKESGLFLCGANAWGTRASVAAEGDVFILNGSDGAYSIYDATLTTSNKCLGDNLFVDNNNGTVKFTFAAVDGESGVFSIAYDSKYLAKTSTAATVTGYEIELVSSVTEAAKWYILTKDEAIKKLASATEASPISATFLLSNPNFSSNHSVAAWTMEASNKNLGGGNADNFCAESFHSTFTLTQTLTGMPNGVYTLSAQGFYRQDGSDNDNLPVFYLNDATVTFPLKTGTENSMSDASTSFNGGTKYLSTTDKVIVTDGTITVGAKNGANTNLWCIWDNFQLTYYGAVTDFSAYVKLLKEQVDAGTAIKDKKMNATVKTKLENAITDYQSKTESSAYSTEAEWSIAIAAMKTAVSDANASVAVYESVLAYFTTAATLDDAGVKNFNANTTVAEIKSAYDAATLESITTEQETAITEALRTAAKAQTTAGADMTLAIVNPTVDGATGWTISKPNGGNGPLKDNISFEYWKDIAANGSFDYYQEITNLPAGKYTVSAEMYNSTNGEGTTFSATSGVYASSGSSDVYKLVDVDGTSLIKYTTDNILVTNGTLRIGVKNQTTMTARWFVADNFTLTFVEAVELDDYYTQITGLLTTAEAITGDMSEAASKALTDAMTAGKAATGTTKETDISKLNTIIDNLNTSIAAANVSVAEFKRGAAVNELITATSGSVDVSSAVVNSDQFTGWSQSGTGKFEKNTWSSEGKTDGSNMLTPFAQNWIGSGNILADNVMTFNTIGGLKAGQYKVSLLTRVMNEKAAVAYSGATFHVNGATVSLTEDATALTGKNGVYKTVETVVTVADKGSLAISVEVKNANFNWVAFKNLKIVYLNDNVTLTDGVDAPLAADLTTNYVGAKDIKVSFTRNFTEAVSSTVCLPFEATPDASAGKFYAFTGVTENEGVYTVNMTQAAATLAANTPYLFVPATTGDVTFTGTVAEAASAYTPKDVTVDEWTFAGTYSKVTYDEDSKWSDYAAIYGYVAKDLGDSGLKPGEFVKMKKPGSSYTPAFRAVMKYKAASSEGGAEANVRGSISLPSSLQVVLVDADGTITEIGAVDVDTDTSDCSWYTIDGRKLQGQPSVKGIYINSGKKILIK